MRCLSLRLDQYLRRHNPGGDRLTRGTQMRICHYTTPPTSLIGDYLSDEEMIEDGIFI